MNINDIYQSNSAYLKAEDLKGRRVNVIIDGAEVEEIGGTKKIVLSFEDKEKKLALNITNARIITSLLESADTRDWMGKEIILRPDKTNYQGELVDCIRVDSILPEKESADKEIPF